MKNVLVGCTGSVATIKIPDIIDRLLENPQIFVKLVVTEHSIHFLPELSTLKKERLEILTDSEEWTLWEKRGDPVLHIELRKWADVAIIAPLSANSLAKVSNGFADNLLTCVLRAWDFKKPIIVAPAMNTLMWEHPVTQPQINILQSWGYTVLPTQIKTLVCGDQGAGAMASVDDIMTAINNHL